MNVYTPAQNKIIHNIAVNLTGAQIDPVVHIRQYDSIFVNLEIELFKDDMRYVIPPTCEVHIRYEKPDGTFIYNPILGWNEERTIVYVEMTYQMTILYGLIEAVIEVSNYDELAYTGRFKLDIARNPIQNETITSTDEYKSIREYYGKFINAVEVIQKLYDHSTALANQVSEDSSEVFRDKQDVTNMTTQVTTDTQSVRDLHQEVVADLQTIIEYMNATIENFKMAKSYAVGNTGIREGENVDNAKYYLKLAEQVSSLHIATTEQLGIVKPDGNTIIIDEDGTIHAAIDTIIDAMGFCITTTLPANQSSLTVNDTRITANSCIDIYTGKWECVPTNATSSTGSISITFTPQTTDVTVKIYVR